MKPKIRILICDDHTLFREGIRAILGTQPHLEIVGQASNGREAVEHAARLEPDVVLMDISMPDLPGYEATRRILAKKPDTKVLILTMFDEEDFVGRCLTAGACGYMLKGSPASQLVYAIEVLVKGGQYLDPGVAGALMTRIVEGAPQSESSYDRLSQREREVIKLLAEGLSVKDVATRLEVSVKTVDTHKTNLMRKLDLHNKTELVKYAIQQKLITLPVGW
jgi:two-component system response regulator NreC